MLHGNIKTACEDPLPFSDTRLQRYHPHMSAYHMVPCVLYISTGQWHGEHCRAYGISKILLWRGLVTLGMHCF